jgi:UDP-N-acetylmuramate--alanine ligase
MSVHAPTRPYRLHFVGVGGAGMSGVAEILLAEGYVVTGSDIAESAVVDRLRAAGATIAIGHAAENVGDVDGIVVTSAVKADNPEVAEARRRRIPVMHRSEMLAELMRGKSAVAVGGSHGKTTTTSMAAVVLTETGFAPTVVIGGALARFGTGAIKGAGDCLVAEADESDGSFLRLPAVIGVVTNIDAEHLDHYGSFEEVKNAFVAFVNRLPFYGAGIVCVDDPVAAALLDRFDKPLVTYGVDKQADVAAVDIAYVDFTSSFTVVVDGATVGRVTLAMPGIHNVRNALAAIAVGVRLGADPANAVAALEGFTGVGRRLETKGEAAGVTVLDDYGHHPTEIVATLRGLKRGFPNRRLVVAFQPHRYSRTRDQAEAFRAAFGDADELMMTDVYAAGDAPIAGIDGAFLADGTVCADGKPAVYVADKNDLPARLAAVVRPGDIVLTLGAGDITAVGPRLLASLVEPEGEE